MDLSIMMTKKVASSKKHTQFKTTVQEPYPIYVQNGCKAIPFSGAARTADSTSYNSTA